MFEMRLKGRSDIAGAFVNATHKILSKKDEEIDQLEGTKEDLLEEIYVYQDYIASQLCAESCIAWLDKRIREKPDYETQAYARVKSHSASMWESEGYLTEEE